MIWRSTCSLFPILDLSTVLTQQPKTARSKLPVLSTLYLMQTYGIIRTPTIVQARRLRSQLRVARKTEFRPEGKALCAAERLPRQPLLYPCLHWSQDQGEEQTAYYEWIDIQHEAVTSPKTAIIDIYWVNRGIGRRWAHWNERYFLFGGFKIKILLNTVRNSMLKGVCVL